MSDQCHQCMSCLKNGSASLANCDIQNVSGDFTSRPGPSHVSKLNSDILVLIVHGLIPDMWCSYIVFICIVDTVHVLIFYYYGVVSNAFCWENDVQCSLPYI